MEAIDGLMNAFLLDGKGGGQKLNWDDIRALNPEQGPAWVRLDFTNPNALQWLHDESGLDPIIAEAVRGEFLLKQQLDVGIGRHNTFARCNCLAEQVG